jgi:hypothetical protein
MANISTITPFARGDILVGCTVLNRPEDDHAGDGRIIQYDANLKEKGVLWIEDSTHLIVGLRFSPDKLLWAFDSNNHQVIHVSPEGKRLPARKFADRSFSSVNFAPDGTLLFGEHLVGKTIKLPPERPLGTTLSKVPGTDLFGYGHVYRYSTDGKLLKEYATDTNGGMGGFLGVTTSSLAADGRTLVYTSETGPCIYQYDVVADRQLPNLMTLGPGAGMALLAQHQTDGTLLAIKAVSRSEFKLEHVQPDGTVVRSWDLPGPGWANIANSIEPGVVLLGNFFTGELGRFDLKSGQLTARVNTGVQRSLAGIAQYPG